MLAGLRLLAHSSRHTAHGDRLTEQGKTKGGFIGLISHISCRLVESFRLPHACRGIVPSFMDDDGSDFRIFSRGIVPPYRTTTGPTSPFRLPHPEFQLPHSDFRIQ
jgi:hypothetical protein